MFSQCNHLYALAGFAPTSDRPAQTPSDATRHDAAPRFVIIAIITVASTTIAIITIAIMNNIYYYNSHH